MSMSGASTLQAPPTPESPSAALSQSRSKSGYSSKSSDVSDATITAPGPLPRKDPLAALQRGEALERRASRRFSAYQFAKLANGGSKEVPDLPPLPSDRNSAAYLPTKTPRSTSRAEFTSSTALLGDGELPHPAQATLPSSAMYPKAQNRSAPTTVAEEVEETVPEKITLFLQVMRSVKKCVVEPSELTIPALRLLFIDKFAYSNSDAFPDIYIQDPKSGIRYELDEESLANDVRSGCMLSLNVEVVDEVKKQIDDGLMALTKHVIDLNNKVTSNSASISQLTELQRGMQEAYEKAAAMGPQVATPISGRSKSISKPSYKDEVKLSLSDAQKLSDLRKDIAVVKQISSHAILEMRGSIAKLVKNSQTLQSANALPPPGDSSRSFMERCFKKLSGDSDKLLTEVDDLQDVIEALRKDVAQRAVRPDLRRLTSVSKELKTAKEELQAMEKFIAAEKAGWKKIWERELDKICEEQQTLKLHEDIVVDLFDDLEKAAQTFELVEQASSELNASGSRPLRHVMLPPPVESVVHAKDAVLSEVSALQPNHERRVEAIERAEKLRKKELEMRGIQSDEFQQELGEFVANDKLKKSGGVAEVERMMALREAKAREEARKLDRMLIEQKEQKRLERAGGDKKKKEKKEKKDKKDKKEKKEKKKKVKSEGADENETHNDHDDDDDDDDNSPDVVEINPELSDDGGPDGESKPDGSFHTATSSPLQNTI